MLRSWSVLVLLSCFCLPGRAGAFAALPVSEGKLDTERVRLVVAAHPERSTLWVEWMLRVSGDRFVVLVPLVSEGTLDTADPAWFEAIEHATAPRVLPPPDVALEECGASPGVHDTSDHTRAERAFPREVTLLSDDAALAEFLVMADLDREEPVSFADFGDPAAVVALEYPAVPGAPMLVDLRLEAELTADAWLDRVALIGQKQRALVTLTVFAEAPFMLDPDDVVFSHELVTRWRAASDDSDYLEGRSRLLAYNPKAWVTEVVGATHIFDPYYPDAQATVPSVIDGFRDRLAERGYACPDWSEWLDTARAENAVAPKACGSGELASLKAPECLEDANSVNDLACEGVLDLALALSGARVNDVVLTRHVGWLPAACTLAADPTAENHTVKVYADFVASSECASAGAGGENASDGSGGGTGGSGDDAGSAGGSGGGAATTRGASGNGVGFGGGGWEWPSTTGENPDPPPPHEPDDLDGEIYVYAETDSCSSGTQDQDACSGDSSSSSSDESCSGDSSSDTSDGESSCEGDSSESSGDTCSGDSSADVEGDTCSSTGEGGDATCASGGSGGGCAVGRFGLPRPRLSVVTMILGGLLLPWRRRHRRQRRAASA